MTPQELKIRWGGPPSQFVDLDGQSVHYRDEGPRDAPVLLLLHGTSSSLHCWDGWADALRHARRVIRLDLPAFGLTGPWTGKWRDRAYGIADYVELVAAFADHLKIGTLELAGNSLGGGIALQFASQQPHRVSALVLVDAAGYAKSLVRMPFGWHLARVAFFAWLGTYFPLRQIIVQGLRLSVGRNDCITETMVDRYLQLNTAPGNLRALGQRINHHLTQEGVEHIQGVHAPTLVLWGERDRLIPVATAQRFLADIAGSIGVFFEDLGHIPHEEDPMRTVAEVQRFLHIPPVC
jgi:pimeloyl-ACP methyl ester carboxylesterase